MSRRVWGKFPGWNQPQALIDGSFYESHDGSDYASGENLVGAPDGQFIICQDQVSLQRNNPLQGYNRDGQAYPLAQPLVQTEMAGICFSPDGRHVIVNVYSPTGTLAISGPWAHPG